VTDVLLRNEDQQPDNFPTQCELSVELMGEAEDKRSSSEDNSRKRSLFYFGLRRREGRWSRLTNRRLKVGRAKILLGRRSHLNLTQISDKGLKRRC
jgi:hypothetical protein